MSESGGDGEATVEKEDTKLTTLFFCENEYTVNAVTATSVLQTTGKNKYLISI